MGLVGNSTLTGYSATKGALISGSKSMAVELAKKKIRVNWKPPVNSLVLSKEDGDKNLESTHNASLTWWRGLSIYIFIIIFN